MRALRVSYVGELGWELHPPIGLDAALYDAVWERGRAFGIANYGLYAVNTMRIEKGYKAWSTELTNELNMLEADMPRFFNNDKEDFVGKAATPSAGAAAVQDRLRRSRCDGYRCARRRAGTATGSAASASRPRAAMATASGRASLFACVEPAIRSSGQRLRRAHPGRAARGHGAPAAGLRSRQICG